NPKTGSLIVTTPNLESLGHWWFGRHWRGLEGSRPFFVFFEYALCICANKKGLHVQRIYTKTRIADSIYVPSVGAKKGLRDLGRNPRWNTRIRIWAYGYQLIEDTMRLFRANLGEELFCLCSAAS